MTTERFARKFERWKSALIDLTGRNRLLRHRPSRSASLQIKRPGVAALFTRLAIDDKAWRVCLKDPDAEEREKRKAAKEKKKKAGKKKKGKARGKRVAAELAATDAADFGTELTELPDDGEDGDEAATATPAAPRGGYATPDDAIELRDDECLAHRRGKKAERCCTHLMRALRQGLEEQGIHVLHLTLGMLRWTEEDKASKRDWVAPLLVLPVGLERRSMRDPFRIVPAEDELRINPALIEKLRLTMNITLPPLPEDLTGFDPAAWAAEVQEIVAPLKGWTVAADEVWLDRFDFTKVAMYSDLLAHPQRYEQHSIVRALAGETEGIPEIPAGLPTSNQLDERVPVNEQWHVLDADSSQHEAIELVRRGCNLVLEGPPGTGKSQTITNMIAELLAAGKRVLFVSEKRAALEVVWRRLHTCGLGDYTLDLHNPRLVNRKTVAIDLYNAWRGVRHTPSAPFVDFGQVQAYRDRLNQYVSGLHTPQGKLQLSPWQGYQKYWDVVDAADLRWSWPDPLGMTPELLRRLEEGVERLTNHMHILRDRNAHPWSFVDAVDTSLKFRETVEDEFRDALKNLRLAADWAHRTAEELGVQMPDTLPAVEQFAAAISSLLTWPHAAPHVTWFWQANMAETLELVREAGRRGPRLVAAEESLLSRYHEDLLKDPRLRELLLRANGRIGWGAAFFRWLNPGYWGDRKLIFNYLLPAAKKRAKLDPSTVAADCRAALDLNDDRDWYRQNNERLRLTLDNWFMGPGSSWDNTAETLEWVLKQRRDHSSRFTGELLQHLIDEAKREHWKHTATDGSNRVQVARAKLRKVLERFPRLDTVSSPLAEGTRPVASLIDWFERHLRDTDKLHEWMAWLRAESHLLEAGFRQVMSALEGTKLPPERIVPAVMKRFWRLWVDAAQLTTPPLADFRGDHHENLIQRFRSLDNLVPKTGATRITQQLETERPQWAGYTPDGSEPQILTHQASLKRGHLSVRRLLERIPRLALRLKPCWMMSPLSVCHYLTSEHKFDVVIFDEASQVRPEDAIPAIRRGAQVVIVGDRQQLPPTTFFEQVGSELEEFDEDDVDLAPLESVLEEAARFFPVRRLCWHYRSKDESLIAYSNRKFYDDQLITFPAPRVPGLDSQRSGNTRRFTKPVGPESGPSAAPTATVNKAGQRGKTGKVSKSTAAIPPTEAGADASTETRLETAELVKYPTTPLEVAELVSEPPPPVGAIAPEATPANGAVDAPVNVPVVVPAPHDESADATAVPIADPPLGIQHIRVPKPQSNYSKGRNPAEAEIVVDRVVQIARRFPEYSIGVVAFGISQAQLIEDLLEAEREADPDFDRRFDPELEEPIFVKNLETVQGDERDIIIFSVTYGPEEDGLLRLNFGPIQNQGGERRLNVAFTRARYHIVLISSISARDIDPARAHSEGAIRLREYLEYAEHQGRFPDTPATRHEAAQASSSMIGEVQRALELQGYRVHPRVGQGAFRIDLAIVHPDFPGQYILGVESDGPTYEACNTARDRDRTRPDILSHLGWNLAHVWSRDRFERPDEVADQIVRRIEHLAGSPVSLPRPPRDAAMAPAHHMVEHTLEAPADPTAQAAADLNQVSAGQSPFATYREAVLQRPDGVDSPADLDEAALVQLLNHVVEVEGPVHRDLIYNRVKDAWELKVRSKKVTEAIDAALQVAEDHAIVRRVGDFFWPPTREVVRPRVPDKNANPRDIQHICVDELEALMTDIVRAALSIGRDDLLDSTSRALGYAQLSGKRKSRLAAVLQGLLTNGRMTTQSEGVVTMAANPRG